MEPGRASPSTYRDLSRYIQQTHEFPMLTLEAEQDLSRRWQKHHDITAAHQMVSSHLRLVIKIAKGYAGYGLPIEDLIGEGQLGLMQAACRFDPDRGVRFATYAVCWVHASIREYVLRNWSLVKIGTTAAQRKLFFNLRRARNQLQMFDNGSLTPENVIEISTQLRVPQQDVISMDQRMSGPDLSLNAPKNVDGDDEWQSFLVDDDDGPEHVVAEGEELRHRRSLLSSALGQLTARERHIVCERRLKDRPTSLADLSQHFGISNERVRQIESRAMDKLQRSVRMAAA